MIVATGSNDLSEAKLAKLASLGLHPASLLHPTAVISPSAVISEGYTVLAGAAMAGHTEIGRKAYLGIGCTIIDDIRVGVETIVGAGAVVIRDIPDHAVVAGVPAKAIR